MALPRHKIKLNRTGRRLTSIFQGQIFFGVKGYVFIMGYVTFSLGCYMVCCSVASLAVGYIYSSCSHLYSFASYDRPYALKIMSDVEDVTPANTDFPSSDVFAAFAS